MEAIRYIQKVTADSLTIEVSKYRGKNVEIIIIPLDDETENQGSKQFKSVKGALHNYASSKSSIIPEATDSTCGFQKGRLLHSYTKNLLNSDS